MAGADLVVLEDAEEPRGRDRFVPRASGSDSMFVVNRYGKRVARREAQLE